MVDFQGHLLPHLVGGEAGDVAVASDDQMVFMKNTSGPDRNDKLMKRAGFRRSDMDNPQTFNRCGGITYWVNDYGLRVITTKNVVLSLRDLLVRVMNQSAYRTRRHLKEKISQIDCDVKGFIYEKDQS